MNAAKSQDAKHASWLAGAKKRFPIGCHVRVVGGDVPEYIGQRGIVEAYDLGCAGDTPLVYVAFTAPIETTSSSEPAERDVFFADGDEHDEIVRCED